MLTRRSKEIERAVAESLRKCASLVEPAGAGRWDFILSNGSALPVCARAEGGWLRLDAPVEGAAQAHAWGLLRLNRALRGLAKVAFPPGARRPHLRAEIPLDGEAAFSSRLLEACAGFKSAAGALHGEKPATGARGDYARRPQASARGDAAPEARDLGRLCEQAGWAFSEKSAARVEVVLKARGDLYRVAVEGGAAGVALSVGLAPGHSFGEVGRAALGDILLRASAAIRMARAAAAEEEGRDCAGFEVVFGAPPCPAEFAHALSALAVACSLCGREAAALADDESLAERYLALRGPAAEVGGREVTV